VRWLVVFKREYQGLSAEVVHEHLLLLYPSARRRERGGSLGCVPCVLPQSAQNCPKTASVTAHAASHRRLLNNHSTLTGTLARPRLRDDAPWDEHLMSIFIPCVSRVRARLSREPLLGLDVFVIWPCGAS